MFIAAMIVMMLSLAVMIFIVAMRTSQTKSWQDIVQLSSLGALFLGALFFVIPTTVTGVIGLIFWIPGWLGLAASFVLLNQALVAGIQQKLAAMNAQAARQEQVQATASNQPSEQE